MHVLKAANISGSVYEMTYNVFKILVMIPDNTIVHSNIVFFAACLNY